MKTQIFSKYQQQIAVDKQAFNQATATNRSAHDSNRNSMKHRKNLTDQPTIIHCLVAKPPKLLGACHNSSNSQSKKQETTMIETSQKSLPLFDRISQLCNCLKIENEQKSLKMKSFQSQRRNLLTLLSGAPTRAQKTISPINSLLNLLQK